MTLMLITVMSMLISAVVMLYLAQYRFIRRDAHRLQARYSAEAGVYVAMDSLQRNPFWRVSDERLTLPEGMTSTVTVEPYGGYVLIRAEAVYRRRRATVRALVGEKPPPPFQNAIQLGDGESGLQVVGTTRIKGNMVVGRRGVKARTFKRRRFTGRIQGVVFSVPDLAPPYFDKSFLQNAVVDAEHLLHDAPRARPVVAEKRPLAKRLPSENEVYFTPGNLQLTERDTLLLREPMTVVAGGDLTLKGPLQVRPGTILIAGKTLQVQHVVTGRDGLFYGREGVVVADSVHLSGQFLSQRHIRVAASAYVSYPSLLYVTGQELGPGGGIVMEDGSVVDGTIIHPLTDPASAVRRGRVRVASAAQVRGAIFNAHDTEFHGTLYGTMLTRALYFYESPTSYINWLKDALIDIEQRPLHYVLPLRFSLQPRLTVMNWEIFVEASEPSLPLSS